MIFAFLKKKAPDFGALTFPLAIFLSFYANISGNTDLIVISAILSVAVGLIVSALFFLFENSFKIEVTPRRRVRAIA